MNKSIFKFVSPLILITVLSPILFAGAGKMVIIEGKIKSFTDKTIKIATSSGDVSVPRSSIPVEVTLKPNEQVKIPVEESKITK